MPRGEYTLSPYGRGRCPVCMGTFNLTKNGVMRHHTDAGERQTGWPYRAPVCKGVGETPKAGS